MSLSRWRPLWSTLAKLPDAKLLPAQPRCLLPSCKVPKYSQMKSLLKMKKLENPRVFPNDAPPWSTPAKMPDAKLLPAQPSCLLPRCRVPEYSRMKNLLWNFPLLELSTHFLLSCCENVFFQLTSLLLLNTLSPIFSFPDRH